MSLLREAPGPRRLVAGAGAILLVAMLASFAPTPLYPLYREAFGVGDVGIGIVFAAYPVGVLTVLVLLGGLSDRLGRRRTLLLGLTTLAVALAVMGAAPSVAVLVTGRLLQGLGAGLLTATGAAALMELHPRGAFLNTACLSVGMALGPVLAGGFAEGAAAPLVLPYAVIAALLVVPAVLLLSAAGDAGFSGPVRLVRPVRVPSDRRGAFCVAGAAIACTNLTTAVYGSFGADIAGTVGWSSEAQSGRLVSLVLVSLAAVQFLGRGLSHTTSISTGAVSTAVGWAVAWLAATTGSAALLLAAAVVSGSAAGLCLLGSAALVGQLSPRDRRAETYAAYLLVSFSALALVALVAAPVVARSVLLVLGATSVVAAAVAVVVVTGARRILSGSLPLERVEALS